MSTSVSISAFPGNRYRDITYPSGVATHSDRMAAIVQEISVRRMA